MRLIHILQRKKIIFLNIFLFSYILINLFDGDRGLFSYLEKSDQKNILIKEEKNLQDRLKIIEHKNYLLSENINADYMDTLLREKLKFGKSGEKVIRLND
tara:strand:+ start:668 stop:967 length:300 start_codon:yes stop_codon:yes gene_type:complete